MGIFESPFSRTRNRATANVYVTATGVLTMTGSGTWDDWVATTFATIGLVRFTESGGVLTYTGPGEWVWCGYSARPVPNFSGTHEFGIRKTGSAPVVQASFGFTTNQLRDVGVGELMQLANGDTIAPQFKASGASPGTITSTVGDAIIVVGI